PTSAMAVMGACIVVSICSNLESYRHSAPVRFTPKDAKSAKENKNELISFLSVLRDLCGKTPRAIPPPRPRSPTFRSTLPFFLGRPYFQRLQFPATWPARRGPSARSASSAPNRLSLRPATDESLCRACCRECAWNVCDLQAR